MTASAEGLSWHNLARERDNALVNARNHAPIRRQLAGFAIVTSFAGWLREGEVDPFKTSLRHKELVYGDHLIVPAWTKLTVRRPDDRADRVQEVDMRIGRNGATITGTESLVPLLEDHEYSFSPYGPSWSARKTTAEPIQPDEAMRIMYEQLQMGATATPTM